MARNVRRAAVNDDAERLRAELIRLRAELTDHVHGERAARDLLPGAAADVAGHGQQRLLRLVGEVRDHVSATTTATVWCAPPRSTSPSAPGMLEARLARGHRRRHP